MILNDLNQFYSPYLKIPADRSDRSYPTWIHATSPCTSPAASPATAPPPCTAQDPALGARQPHAGPCQPGGIEMGPEFPQEFNHSRFQFMDKKSINLGNLGWGIFLIPYIAFHWHDKLVSYNIISCFKLVIYDLKLMMQTVPGVCCHGKLSGKKRPAPVAAHWCHLNGRDVINF